MSVELVTATEDGESLILYMARVSNPKNQNSGKPGLIKYCLDHNHWSIFEHAHMSVEIVTTRAIAAQILRHRSFCFQEFSQRYAEVSADPSLVNARRQDSKNRQNSIDDLDHETKVWWESRQEFIYSEAMYAYNRALQKGIAKECARFILPLASPTKLYMTGNVRSWIHYIQLRTDPSTQLEHREIAEEVKNIFTLQFPTTSQALKWGVDQ